MAACIRGASRLLGLLALLAPGAGVAAARHSSADTPVEKVAVLLQKLGAQLEADGKKDAAQYDKYACFCKEQADEKIYAIDTSKKIIKALEAKIKKLGDELTTLDSEIGDLGEKISDLDGKIKQATETREGEHEAYVEKEADISGAISAVERAIAEMDKSKKALSGKVDREDALVQVRAAAKLALGVASRDSRARVSESQIRLLNTVNQSGKPGKAYEYEYHANDIIETLKDLRKTFLETKERIDQEEFDAQATFDKKRLNLQNEMKWAEEDKTVKEKIVAQKTEEKQDANMEKDVEVKDKDADLAFLSELTPECEQKAKDFDERSKTRADEIKAVKEATEVLVTKVAPEYSANKKLVDLQRSQGAPAAARHAGVRPTTPPPAKEAARASTERPAASFLQLRGSRGLSSGQQASGAEALRTEVMKRLNGAASRLQSPVLSLAAVKVQAAEDHFVKVRSLIKDIMARLKADAEAEADTKSFCDKEMEKTTNSRDSKKEKLESLAPQILSKESEMAQLKEEIAALSKDIAANMKSLSEATELRADEKAENEDTVEHAKAGKEAVETVISILKDFYGSEGALLQQKQRTVYEPPNAARGGETVADLAPEITESEYTGRTQSSTGVLGMLDVILADFDRTVTTVEENEKLSQDAFDDLKKETELDTEEKDDSKKEKEGKVTKIEDDLVNLADEKMKAQEDYDLAISELAKLKKMCVDGESYEDRAAKRKQEIEALKEAHAMLESWQG